MKTKVTNRYSSPVLRGGRIFQPGQTTTLELSDEQLRDVKSHPSLAVAPADKPKPKPKPKAKAALAKSKKALEDVPETLPLPSPTPV